MSDQERIADLEAHEREQAAQPVGIDEAEDFLSKEIRADLRKLREFAAKNPMPKDEGALL